MTRNTRADAAGSRGRTSQRTSAGADRPPTQSAGRAGALQRQAREQAAKFTVAADWHQWCHLVARLPTFGLDNTLLIAAACPQASQLAGYEAWQTLDRQVRRGEKGIAVLAPSTGATLSRVTHLWDVTQTDGAAAPGNPAQLRVREASAAEVWERLVVLAGSDGRAIERGVPPLGAVAGLDPATGGITVLPAVPAAAAAFETARVLLSAQGRTPEGAVAAATVWAAAHGLLPETAIDMLPAPATTAGDGYTAAQDLLSDVQRLLAATATPASPDEQTNLQGLHDRASVRLDVSTDPGLDHAQPVQPAAVEPDLVQLRAVHREALRFYRAQLPDSWAADYLAQRLPGIDANSIAAGCAPADWTGLTKHLRAAGYADESIISAGLATRARHGGLVDRFRDRLMLPIRDHDGSVIAFVGRARPGTENDQTPKYLNSPTTSLYRKGEVVYGLSDAAPHLAQRPMLVPVEGPLDALAVTYGTAGRAVGLASLGTAWTHHQVSVIHAAASLVRHDVVVATDPDPAGLKSARVLYELLTQYGADPRHAALPPSADPAALYAEAGPARLLDALTGSRPLSHSLIEHAAHEAAPELDKGWSEQRVAATRAAVTISAALPPGAWERDLAHIVAITGIHPNTARHELVLAYIARPEAETGMGVITGAGAAVPPPPRQTAPRSSGAGGRLHSSNFTSAAPAPGLAPPAAPTTPRL